MTAERKGTGTDSGTSSAALVRASTAFVLCERCKQRPWEELWSADGLVGHATLVCRICWEALDANEREAAENGW